LKFIEPKDKKDY
jgi:p21-activated kinase 1